MVFETKIGTMIIVLNDAQRVSVVTIVARHLKRTGVFHIAVVRHYRRRCE